MKHGSFISNQGANTRAGIGNSLNLGKKNSHINSLQANSGTLPDPKGEGSSARLATDQKPFYRGVWEGCVLKNRVPMLKIMSLYVTYSCCENYNIGLNLLFD